jgi:MFS family permease
MTAGNLMLGVTLLGGVVGPIVCGQLLDRVFKGQAKTVFLIGFAMMCVFVYALKLPLVVNQVAVLEAVLILAGFGVQLVLPTIYYFIAKAYPPQVAGKMSGIWIGIGTFGGVLGMYIAGVTVRTQNSYQTTLTLQSVTALIGFVLVFALAAAHKPEKNIKAAGVGR